jgi:hypothetical protein
MSFRAHQHHRPTRGRRGLVRVATAVHVRRARRRTCWVGSVTARDAPRWGLVTPQARSATPWVRRRVARRWARGRPRCWSTCRSQPLRTPGCTVTRFAGPCHHSVTATGHRARVLQVPVHGVWTPRDRVVPSPSEIGLSGWGGITGEAPGVQEPSSPVSLEVLSRVGLPGRRSRGVEPVVPFVLRAESMKSGSGILSGAVITRRDPGRSSLSLWRTRRYATLGAAARRWGACGCRAPG